jgi:hypothetical protein
MADDELPPALEEVDQAALALRALEAVVLGDLDHRQAAALGAELVARAGHRLLLLEQRDPRPAPLLVAHCVWKRHGVSTSRGTGTHRWA